MAPELVFELPELGSGKSLDTAVWSDPFATDPNENVCAPVGRRDPAGNTGQSRAVLSADAVITSDRPG
jgi:hypothetical protein